MIDQDVTHQARRQREEMRPVPRCLHTSSDEPYIRLVHEGRRLQRMIPSLVTETRPREPAKFVIGDLRIRLFRPW